MVYAHTDSQTFTNKSSTNTVYTIYTYIAYAYCSSNNHS